MQLVLDTNVWIDWLVFDDPAIAPLKEAHRKAVVQIVMDQACLAELREVLGYPEFRLTEAQRQAALAEVDRCCSRNEPAQGIVSSTLPRCDDPDDQKFLELARDARTDSLITRDKALLRLGKKKLMAAGFRVGTPQQWMDAASA